MQLTFMGAAGTVTGSKYLLSIGKQKLLVDCGLFQGYKDLRLRNWTALPIKAHEIDAVVITHAHIDHTGYLPLLIKQGFRGPVYATPATIDLCSILLPDSGYLQEEEAASANRHRYSKHNPAMPLYTKEDAIVALKQFVPVDFMHTQNILSDVEVTFYPAGHILGASIVEIKAEDKRVVFTGDMGRVSDPLMRPPHIIESADYLIIESTYGDRLHDKEDVAGRIAKLVNETAKRGGTLLIPAFAVGRAQTLLYYLSQLKVAKAIPDMPIYLDSPMAINATELMCRHKDELKVTPDVCRELCSIATYVNSVEESKALDTRPYPKIIISASGMATGGRILYHLKVFLGDARNTILFTGFQAGGTRGDRIVRLEQEIKIHGQMFPVRAHIENMTALSAHADYADLLEWLKHFKQPPRHTFITHGEKQASLHFKQEIENTLHWPCTVPQYLDVESLF